MTKWYDWLGIELSVGSVKERLISGLGGFLALLLLLWMTERCLHLPHSIGVVASMGASAVLLYAVPHGQLSQPWPVIGGHGLSALIGVACARWIASPDVAAACAVGISIAVMYQLKCIHPPGGATALTAVLGGAAIHGLGFKFVWMPVVLNAVVMVAVAMLFNCLFHWRRYPAAWSKRTAKPVAAIEGGPTHEEVVAALRKLDVFVDVTEEELLEIFRLLPERTRMPLHPRHDNGAR